MTFEELLIKTVETAKENADESYEVTIYKRILKRKTAHSIVRALEDFGWDAEMIIDAILTENAKSKSRKKTQN